MDNIEYRFSTNLVLRTSDGSFSGSVYGPYSRSASRLSSTAVRKVVIYVEAVLERSHETRRRVWSSNTFHKETDGGRLFSGHYPSRTGRGLCG